uniref:Uncharacterized protein n=1 Tax=Theileria annulata TaxID=5874 RepID=A0A3B0MMT1_THEAN
MKNINIIEEEEDYGNIIEEEEMDDINFEESDEELPIVINEDEFIKQFTINEKTKSPSPPRKIVNELDNEDDIVYRDKYGKRITRDQWLLLNQVK